MAETLAWLLVACAGLACLAARRWPLAASVASAVAAAGALAVALADLGSASLLVPVALAALAAGVLTSRPRMADEEDDIEHLRTHIMRCRRQDESASVLVATLRGRRIRGIDTLRVTDSAAMVRASGTWELQAVLHGDDLPRVIVEARLSEEYGADLLAIGWAVFPHDGLTLDSLLEAARIASTHLVQERAPAVQLASDA